MIEVSGRMRSDAFSKKVKLPLHCNNFYLKQFYTKTSVKADLNVKK